MSDAIVQYALEDNVAVITMNDGKANALSFDMIEQFDGALDRAEEEADAVLIVGRPGRFSAGFDLRIMLAGPEQAKKLLVAGSGLFMRVYEYPKPVVMCCTGHAIAGGALLLATGDTRFGVKGEFKIGLNEVANSMPVPILAHQLAKDRLATRELVPSVLFSKIYSPTEAAAAGWLDYAVDADDLLDASMSEAKRLAELPSFAFAHSKASLRRASIEHIRTSQNADFNEMVGALGQ